MSVLYHPSKENVVVDALSQLSMGSIAHAEDGQKELVSDVHDLAQLGIHLVDSIEDGVIAQNSLELSLVSYVKSKQVLDLFLV